MSTQPIGLDSALSRISQIQSYQQQLLDPATAVGSSTSGASGATSTSTATSTGSTGSGSNFASLLSALTEESSLNGALNTDSSDDASDDSSLTDGSTGTSADSSLLSSLTGGSSGTSGDSSLLSSLTGGSGASADSALLSSLTGGTSGSSDSSLLSELTSLASTNPSLLASLSGTGASAASTAITGASADAPAAVQAMTEQANALVGKPYIWGGGHSGWGEQPGYDCSGFVSAVLHAGGYLSSPQDTQTLPSAAGIESGPGQYVTIYDRTDAGTSNDHVIIDINGQFYESGGEANTWGGGGGVQQIATPSASYLASFNQQLHPEGL